MDKSVLKIGELAARSGLTVRALHHYDSIGLLTPSAHTDSGYRLYTRSDVARLHQIQALRRFGMSLSDIGTFLASPDAPFADVVAQQIAALSKQIEQAGALRDRLTQLQQQMVGGSEPELEDWLSALEHMNLYEQYFTQEELRRLPFWQQDARRNAAWIALVAEVRAMMDKQVPADSPQAGLLSQRWMEMLEQDTAANPDFAQRLTTMLEQEAGAQRHTFITPEVKEYVGEAYNAHKMAIYAKYLDKDEMRHIRENSRKHFREWMTLIADVHRHMERGAAPQEPASQALAQEWMRLFRLRAGDAPGIRDKIRHAHDNEPTLLKGTWVSEAMLEYIRLSFASI
jgi:DNA-binding transcriptional MerR regulator